MPTSCRHAQSWQALPPAADLDPQPGVLKIIRPYNIYPYKLYMFNIYYNTIYFNIKQVAGSGWSGAGDHHLAYLWYRRLTARLKRQGWLVNWQTGATAHGSTRSSGEGLLQEKAHH